MTKRTRKRPYRMGARAAAQAETRRRIVEATVELHGTLGPAATTISAIAARAGVQRVTFYRHFPDEAAIFAACTAHWGALHPPPADTAWAGIPDPAARVAAALTAWFDHYADTCQMRSVVQRDVGLVPHIQPLVARFDALLDAVAGKLAAGFGAKGAMLRRLTVTLRHALAFQTWSDLEARGLDTAEKAALVGLWLAGVKNSSP